MLHEVNDRPPKIMNLFSAKPINNHPNHIIGVQTSNAFFLPKYPERTPPKGEVKMPIIQKLAANHEPSSWFKRTASLISASN
jgi:hypothetical protein